MYLHIPGAVFLDGVGHMYPSGGPAPNWSPLPGSSGYNCCWSLLSINTGTAPDSPLACQGQVYP